METNGVTLSNETVVKLAWIGLGTAAIVAAMFAILGTIAFRKSEQTAWAFTRLLERAQAVKMTTVILIVLSTTVLSLFKVVDSNGAVGILGGIVGYVLGGLEKKSGLKEDTDTKKDNTGG